MAQYDATTQVQDTRYLFPINTKSSSNASYVSVYATAQQSQVPLDISPESDHGNLTKAFAERAWQEDPSFIGQEELAEWFGSSSNIRQEALAHYIAHFEFGGLKVDEAIRQLCNKLYLKGRTREIDRVLEAFSKHYIAQNSGSAWKEADVVHTVSFAIVLLNTDLQAAKIRPAITNSQFVDNTINSIRLRLYQEDKLGSPLSDDWVDISAGPRDDVGEAMNEGRHPSEQGRLTNTTRRTQFEAEWFEEILQELPAIYHRIRTNPILHRKPNAAYPKHESSEPYDSPVNDSPHEKYQSSAPGVSFISTLGQWMFLSMTSLPQFIGIAPKQPRELSTSPYPTKSADSPWSKSGSLLWKPAKPAAGRIAKSKRWMSVIANVRSSMFDMTSPGPLGNNGTAGCRIGALSLLHALAIQVPAPRGTKVRSFGLRLASGETHMFEIQAPGGIFSNSMSRAERDPDEEVSAWVRACNYYAARYSYAPFPEAITSAEYGWNGVTEIDDDQSGTSYHTLKMPIEEWVAPKFPGTEAQIDIETQINLWSRRIDMCNTEFVAHSELRVKMMSLHHPGSTQAQKALSNWEAKAQYLLTEIVKYETYAEVLKNTELPSQGSI